MLRMKKITLDNPFAAPVFHREITASTMLDARTLAEHGKPHGSVVAADVQEAGRGRVPTRPWKSEKGQNLLFTILLRYSGIAAIPPAVTLRTGLALALAIEDFAPALQGRLRVKWPNDVMIPLPSGTHGKIAGILTEGDGENVYIGIGVNVGQAEFPPDIRDKAGSIALALRVASLPPDSRFRLLEAFLRRLHAEIEGPSTTGSWRERLEERLYLNGRRVRFIAGAADSGRVVEGVLCGIGVGGELLIQGQHGTEAFVTGELEAYYTALGMKL
ncbi:biotin--[acetyl-CoA-carboxylase] ligase [Spirochaetia bacterium]|nr:biotin--[acetyl-CoA-carboxylase] ligase [Spirochaetia bacterium]